MKKVGVALLGLGTVGGGTYKILTKNRDDIKKNYGVDLEIRHILEKDMSKVKALGANPDIVSCDINNILKDPEIKIVAEFFGGIEPAKSFLVQCLLAGKSIVTANKEMFSQYWHELESAAKKGKAGVYFEASCVGGVPVIRTLTESMQGNNIKCIMGIVNGTTNYILSKMADEGLEYETVLKEAQKLGYAEANPTADVDGYDSMYKLSILSSLAFHTKVPIDKIYREGISNISKLDIEYGKKFGYTLKLLAIGKKENGKIEARVHPAFIPSDHPLAAVKESFNAVHIVGDNVGDIMLYGRGAGDLPTGSAIVSDIVFASLQSKHKYSSFKNNTDKVSDRGFNKDFQCEYYMRLTVKDVPGVIASISAKLAKFKISINSIQQKVEGDKASVIFMLHRTSESSVKKAVEAIKEVDTVYSVDAIIRVEE
ncbi:MAG: homoserine dehydrogenase [Christensenellales bacterium]|jgi:homoserine dehydrogenase|nr:homoserine dehydrogenase [Clostridiales bacterium]